MPSLRFTIADPAKTVFALHHPAWLPLLIVALLAALTGWLNRLANSPVVQDTGMFLHQPDYVVERFQATAFDPAGHPRYSLSAERMTHFMDDGTTHLEQPRIRHDAPGQPRVKARAERGQVSSDGAHVHLIDAVRVEQAAFNGRPAGVLTTAYLDMQPDARVMQTNQPVRFVRGSDVLSAGDFYANDQTGELRLGHGVRGVYASPR